MNYHLTLGQVCNYFYVFSRSTNPIKPNRTSTLWYPRTRVNRIYNGFTHPQMTVITEKEPKATTLYHWGLIPHWAKDRDIRRFTLNAKVETL